MPAESGCQNTNVAYLIKVGTSFNQASVVFLDYQLCT